ncbi:hypothetical protein K488DRAFT_52124 [Vararia minispora EC-137]|uniref:Uncharacterized protein n=1 Tax=Vararia minispora EC-137 TaxID=1314806 RepID=A0ACB8QHV5_9AGAM|nr:hypothetical protein K488DRAFT_52124 [Vararia minispora EC-137]
MNSEDVRVHTSNVTRRVKMSDEQDHRRVFRSVLDNPFHVAWPSTPENVQKELLSHVEQLLVGIANFSARREEAYRQKRKSSRVHSIAKRRKIAVPTRLGETSTSRFNDNVHQEISSVDAVASGEPILTHFSPPIALRHLTIGINEVTRRLETYVRSLYRASCVISSTPAQPTSPSPSASQYRAPVCLVLVCRNDISPPALVAHLPQLVASCNPRVGRLAGEQKQTAEIKLTSLPRGAELIFARALGLKRVAALAIDADMPGLDGLQSWIDSIPILRAPWPLVNAVKAQQSMEPTHIKQLRTTAPKDLRAAREARARGRADAKNRNKSKAQNGKATQLSQIWEW